ncbi:IS66 family transposase [Candidatus Venteria ishoeyi]|uniref:Transposase IS66 family protein n=3 Tax=Candidatus Venteria ishoeyi TaxID=1899563 RepID=A0A1H6FGD8_9GAMM|nr:IS66 family transposase [Candidatus Venteria ishoeyi]SEH08481.1 Transposase IS66 family protein [Candidatus Venteria ishoeyi]
MEVTTTAHSSDGVQPIVCFTSDEPAPFAQETIIITKQQDIEQRCRINYLEAQQIRDKAKIKALEEEIILKDAKINDLNKRLFGKSSEKSKKQNSEKNTNNSDQAPKRNRGQQPGSPGHGRTNRPNLPLVHAAPLDLPDEQKKCPDCGLPHIRKPELDKQSDVIEVEVKAHTRRYSRPAYTRNQGCTCDNHLPTIITAPPPPTLIPHSSYDVSFWVEAILNKYRYGQPANRYLQGLQDLGCPVSPGTLAGGLKNLAHLFDPILEALYIRQMGEKIFHNDETRWEVFVEIEGKVGSRWYLWVTRSQSVIFYCIDPSRSATVPGAHFAGLQNDLVIIICDRYSAYKKLARLADNIILAFCWAHVRRDFLDAGRAFAELNEWGLDWKERIGNIYHLNKLRLEHWNPELPLSEQSKQFTQCQQTLQDALQRMHDEASKGIMQDNNKQQNKSQASKRSNSAQIKQKKVYQSLLDHWQGLTVFVENPDVPMDNNLGENAIRGPVTGRKSYYGSGSIWSAELAAALFSITQTLGVWDINQRHWLMAYLTACAENAGKAPQDINSFIPWLMDETRRAELTRPYPSQAPPANSVQTHLNS